MAPRKAAKHSDMEVVDKAAEAGDVSPPKREKTMAKVAHKTDTEKQIRLPRAAKLAKTEPIDYTDTDLIKNTKTKSKTGPPKGTPIPAKTNSKIKSAGKKNKDVEDTDDISSLNTEDAKSLEEADTKKTRMNNATKKAGIETDEEPKAKSKGRVKKPIATESTANLEATAGKKGKPENTEVIVKESKSKTKSTKKKNGEDADLKNKIVNDDKSTKLTARKARGRKNEAGLENNSKDNEESSSETVDTNDNENQEIQTNHSKETESTHVSKKGKNVKKKEETVVEKKPTKTRGKAINRNVDTVNDENDMNTEKAVKDVQKKTNKENTSVVTSKKGRGKKGTVISTAKDESKEKNLKNSSAEEKKILNSSEALVSNNNMKKSSEDDDEKEQDIEEENASAMHKKSTESFETDDEINVNDSMSS